MMKPLVFLNPSSEDETRKNWRQFQEGSNFIEFSSKIGVTNITNFGSAKAWAQVYGPMAYYWIRLTSGGGNMTSAGAGYITGIPFGPPSLSGAKTTIYTQHLEVVDTNGIPLAGGQKAQLTYSAGVPRINLINVIGTPEVYVYGWFFKDA